MPERESRPRARGQQGAGTPAPLEGAPAAAMCVSTDPPAAEPCSGEGRSGRGRRCSVRDRPRPSDGGGRFRGAPGPPPRQGRPGRRRTSLRLHRGSQGARLDPDRVQPRQGRPLRPPPFSSGALPGRIATSGPDLAPNKLAPECPSPPNQAEGQGFPGQGRGDPDRGWDGPGRHAPTVSILGADPIKGLCRRCQGHAGPALSCPEARAQGCQPSTRVALPACRNGGAAVAFTRATPSGRGDAGVAMDSPGPPPTSRLWVETNQSTARAKTMSGGTTPTAEPAK
mmetsp:Transcript_528/g.1807  ORF Transcript_528/g.1807 Transcript_528/m.1807 type:complete len:283 (+) Transcript_528:177-1025(+)